MQYTVLATDYDGTLADHGRVDEATWAALGRWKAAGGRVVLVTGRELGDLLGVCPSLDRFDLVVLENGALLHRPGDRSETPLAPAPPPGFIEALRAKGVGPISTGRSVVATWEPHRPAIEEVIAAMGLDLRVIPNKRALMVLPPGVDKASGLVAALGALGALPGDVVGFGDAENDLAMLEVCGLAVAVANALPPVRARADLVTRGERGLGVVELVDRLLGDASTGPATANRQEPAPEPGRQGEAGQGQA